MSFFCGDIAHFLKYFFTDTGLCSNNRFALILLPVSLTEFENSIYCCVITSRPPRFNNHLEMSKTEYSCFKKKSFACFDRRDFESLSDLSDRKQPVGKIKKKDVSKALRVLRRVLYRERNINLYLRAALIREWKKLRDS